MGEEKEKEETGKGGRGGKGEDGGDRRCGNGWDKSEVDAMKIHCICVKPSKNNCQLRRIILKQK